MDPLTRRIAHRFAAKGKMPKGKLPISKYKALLKKVRDKAKDMMGSDRSKDAAYWIGEAAKEFGLKGYADAYQLAVWADEPFRAFYSMLPPSGYEERIDKAAD